MSGRSFADVWRRWKSWWGESRIRLSSVDLPGIVDLQPPRLAVGDRLELGSRLWRVEKVDGGSAEIVAVEGPPRRERLDLGEIDPRDVLIYPA